jgi:hypothetical protein
MAGDENISTNVLLWYNTYCFRGAPPIAFYRCGRAANEISIRFVFSHLEQLEA